MDAVSGVIITEIGKAIISELVKRVADKTQTKLSSATTNKALEIAIASALVQYAESESYRCALAKPLFENNGPLSLDPVIEEVSQIFLFKREPDYEKIGRYWKSVFDVPPLLRDFTVETKYLMHLVIKELMASPVFQQVFILKTLEAIAAVSIDSAEHQQRLVQINELIYSKLTRLVEEFEKSSHDLHSDIRDFGSYISERTKGFVGREFVFKRINNFIYTSSRGYFLVWGDPGMGKTALIAQYVKQNGCFHHFNRRSIHLTSTDSFLKNICAQLIAAYQLDEPAPSQTDVLSGAIFVEILHKAAVRRKPDEKIIIVVDALDEADPPRSGATTLYLPDTSDLPLNTYIIITIRKNAAVMLPNGQRLESLLLEPKSDENKADVISYINSWVPQESIQSYLKAKNQKESAFVDTLAERSEYNFMYLHHVLIAISEGVYQDRDLKDLPQGLERYYEEHWELMRSQGSDEEWFNYKMAVLWALVVAEKPLPPESIAKFSRINDIHRVVALLQPRAWGQFLNIENNFVNGQPVKLYSIYHSTFQKFLHDKDEVESYNMSNAAKNRFQDAAMEDLGL